MRLFKKAWAEFDTHQTGYIRRRDFVPFFAVKLSLARGILGKDLICVFGV
jgi:hypothetical protein